MAKLLSDYRLPKNVHGFKCWYCDARLIEDGAKLAFIGVNPTGDQHDAAHDKKERYLDAPYEKRDPLWNAWLDEEWPDGNPYHPYQERVHRLFKEMCGSGWKPILRSTACFNVCPFSDCPDQSFAALAVGFQHGVVWKGPDSGRAGIHRL